VIPRIDRTALEWAFDARYLRPPRARGTPAPAPTPPRDLEDRILLSPAALRLLDQAGRLARRGEGQ
jgi:hypothetical protein